MSNSSKKQQSINDLITELDELVAWFDKDNLDIEEALEKYEASVKLSEQIKNRLGDIDNKITVLKQRFDIEV